MTYKNGPRAVMYVCEAVYVKCKQQCFPEA